MPAMALSRVVESGPDGETLAAGTLQRLEALPDPRSPLAGSPYPFPSRSRISDTIFTARSRSSSGYFRCAALALHPPRNQSLQSSRGDPI